MLLRYQAFATLLNLQPSKEGKARPRQSYAHDRAPPRDQINSTDMPAHQQLTQQDVAGANQQMKRKLRELRQQPEPLPKKEATHQHKK